MGAHPNIDFDMFPKQGAWLGKSCDVVFNYNTKREPIKGVFVRDDSQEPYHSIIQLEDGRFVLTTECMHTIP